MAEKRTAKKRDSNDFGLGRMVDGSTEPPESTPEVPVTTWDFKSDDPAKLAAFIIENTPLVAAYRNALKARRRFPECARRNAEVDKTLDALNANPVARAIHAALVDAGFHWGKADKSPRASFVAGWKLCEALYLWAKADELLRKKEQDPHRAARSPMRDETREKRANNSFKKACSDAWEHYLDEYGNEAKRRDFVEWLKVNANTYEIRFEKDGGRIDQNGKPSGLFEMNGFKPVAPDTVRRWKS